MNSTSCKTKRIIKMTQTRVRMTAAETSCLVVTVEIPSADSSAVLSSESEVSSAVIS